MVLVVVVDEVYVVLEDSELVRCVLLGQIAYRVLALELCEEGLVLSVRKL